jgi:hypothetical protein
MTSTTKTSFARLSTEMARLHAEREALLVVAFEQLGHYRPALSDILLERFGTVARAARWMARRQRVFGDRSPWDLLGEGDEDGVWDLLDGALVAGGLDLKETMERSRQH